MVHVCDSGKLCWHDLPVILKQQSGNWKQDNRGNEGLSLRRNVEELEKKLVTEAMKQAGGNINQAARLLEIPRQTLQYKLKKLT